MKSFSKSFLHVASPVLQLVTILLLTGHGTALQSQAQPQNTLIKLPDKPVAIMPVQDVRIGMKGYGLTVFAGTKIEPFPVEVITIVKAAQPGRAVIWIECDTPRLRNSGPVQGMSGSPIFLWPEGKEGKLGEGGKLIGAFAFGYGGTIDTCLAGVQPIEYMLEVGGRIPEKQAEPQARSSTASQTGGGIYLNTALDRFNAMTRQDRNTFAPIATPMFDAICRMVDHEPAAELTVDPAPSHSDPIQRPQALKLPVTMPGDMANLMRPLMEPMGLMPMAGELNMPAGTPPPGIDPATTMIQPGSVVTIPLAFGDMDLAGSGTVTHVTEDGQVLAFGHSMNGLGDAALPFASGYVQVFVPSRQISFKRGGSLQILGTILRDESAAVAGLPEKRFTTAPLEVTVQMTRQPQARFNYEIVHDPMLAGQIAGALPMMSLMANQGPPIESTMVADVKLDFGPGRIVMFSTMSSPGNPRQFVAEVGSIVTFMQNNPFERVELQSMKANLRVREGLELMQLQRAWASKTQVNPGDEVTIYVQLKPMREDVITRSIKLKVPEQAPEGDYPVIVGGADVYANLLAQANPQRFEINRVDQAVDILNDIGRIPSTNLYAGLLIPNQGVAVGRSRMPNLPSSRAAVLVEPSSKMVLPVPQLVENALPMDDLIVGQSQLMLNVREPYRGVDQPQP